jgi:hypothetical protein
MLALADAYGRVEASIPGIAHQARVPTEATRKAISVLESPDPDSRTPNHEGRRVEKTDGGWQILNYVKYREARNADERREYLRKKQQEFRAKKKVSTNTSTAVNKRQQRKPRSTQAEAEAEAYTEANTNTLVRITADDIESVYRAYPRKVARGAALKAIEGALNRLESPDPVAYLISKAKAFAESEAGNKGKFTPHPATWFNQSRYLDDPKEWEKD